MGFLGSYRSGEKETEFKPGFCCHPRRLDRWALEAYSHLDCPSGTMQQCICSCQDSQLCAGMVFLKHHNWILILYPILLRIIKEIPIIIEQLQCTSYGPSCFSFLFHIFFHLILATSLKGMYPLLFGGGLEIEAPKSKVTCSRLHS